MKKITILGFFSLVLLLVSCRCNISSPTTLANTSDQYCPTTTTNADIYSSAPVTSVLDTTDIKTTTVRSSEIISTESSVQTDEHSLTTDKSSTSEPTIEPDDSDLVRIIDYIPDAVIDLKYATEDNFTGQTIYSFEQPYIRYGTLKKLELVQYKLSQYGIGIKIWDAFRPVSAQQKLWDICPDPTYVSHPVTGSRSHCRGSAVDITLVYLDTGAELEMPTGFDDFSKLADRNYDDCTIQARQNAELLENIMIECGFKPYSAEWWHYSDTVTYSVDEYFEP